MQIEHGLMIDIFGDFWNIQNVTKDIMLRILIQISLDNWPNV